MEQPFPACTLLAEIGLDDESVRSYSRKSERVPIYATTDRRSNL
ncbi:MAG: hypothetical protein QGI68_06910 [Pseudomonadales bacterium]|jgi:hypothetical protein|nr:hypothetical protein [Pseudomonadales bacterium]HJN49321.1 hypothetical protein [Pseudomonadales bacterium]